MIDARQTESSSSLLMVRSPSIRLKKVYVVPVKQQETVVSSFSSRLDVVKSKTLFPATALDLITPLGDWMTDSL